jgi:predicted glycoside hydrolase/deacetylase ChbG (UPF0249 family)
MLIINADDLGYEALDSDRIVDCFKSGLITSASAMVFMQDSRRAAEMALRSGLETGLHLNLTCPFDEKRIPVRLRDDQIDVVRYYRHGGFSQVLYNPFIVHRLARTVKAQFDEYRSLYGRTPAQIDGHHHMHLSMNMIIGQLIPEGEKVRRNFSFSPGEKSLFNRTYRTLVDSWLLRHYSIADFFYSLEPVGDLKRLREIVNRATSAHVELMMHPRKKDTYEYIKGPEYIKTIALAPKCTYRML